jgi:hypothetical protein
MSAPRRLLVEGSSPAVMALLRAARSDEPPDTVAKAKTLSALAAAAATGAVVGKGGGAAGVIAKLLSHSGAKFLAAIALGGSVGVTTLVYLQGRGLLAQAPVSSEVPHKVLVGRPAVAPAPLAEAIPPVTPTQPGSSPVARATPLESMAPTGPTQAPTLGTQSPAVRVTTAALPPSAPVHEAASPPSQELSRVAHDNPAPLDDSSPSPRSARDAPSSAAGALDSRPPPASGPTSASLSSEIAVLDEARAAVAAHDGKAALAAIDRYHATFPRGAFTTEFTVLRIEALFETGDRAHATALANALLKSDPNGPYAKRVRELLAKD